MIQVVAVVGPTGSGKTALGIKLARSLDTEIISADSMQFYRGMKIGTGAPSADELAAVKHHFVGHLGPDQAMSAGEFQIQAREVVASLNEQGKPAVVVGGSGLYIQALIDGLFDGPGRDEAVRERLESEMENTGVEAMYTRLEAVDPDYAKVISKTDPIRIVRALEIYEISGEPASVLYAAHQAKQDSLESRQFLIDYPREVLYERINSRVDAMLEAGLLDEIRALVEAGYEQDIRRLKSLGYREMLSYVLDEREYDEAVELMKMYTRRYAKRQLTWFRGDERVDFIGCEEYATVAFQLEQVVGRLELG
ncbi:MAG: tRNA (adenosine(37)-N6)-dimethylallyltransferase MiaA [Candidatus Hydrogenedentota bacterium]